MKHRIEYIFLRALAAFIQSLSLEAARKIAKFLAAFFYYCIPLRRAITLQQLRFAFPERPEKQIRSICFESYRNLFYMLVEMLWIPNYTDDILRRSIRFENPELITKALKKGRGLIFLSGHLGNWELLAYGCSHLLGVPFTIIIHPQQNKAVADMINELRCMRGNRVVDMRMGVREIIHTLRNRGVVAMLSDQSGPSNSLFVDFFGRPAATYEGPATIALKTNAPMLFATGVRQEDGSYSIFLQDMKVEEYTGGSTKENIESLTTRHVQALEEVIRSYPGQWLWQHRRWKHKPPQQSESPST